MSAYISKKQTISCITRGVTQLLLLFIGLGLVTCSKEQVASKEYPRLSTMEVSGINESGATFNATIISGKLLDIKEYGFVWDTVATPEIASGQLILVKGSPADNQFKGEVHSALRKGVVYKMRSFVRTNDFLVYGKAVTFTSMGSEAPLITGFLPASGQWGDTISITGKNFGTRDLGVIVKMGDLRVPVLSGSDTNIKIVIPDKQNQSLVELSVTVAGNTATSASKFSYKVPVILSISPGLVTFNDTVSIQGEHLMSVRIQPKVNFNDTEISIVYASENLIKVVVPVSYMSKSSDVKVFGSSGFISGSTPLKLKDLILTGYLPDTVIKPAGIITIKGLNFNPNLANNQVLVGGFPATVLEGNSEQLKVQLPEGIIPQREISVFKSAEIQVTVGEQSVKPARNLQVNWRSTWTRKNDFPGVTRSTGIGFTIGQKGYVGLGYNYTQRKYLNDLWEYNQVSDSWVQKADYIGNSSTCKFCITMNGEGYTGLGMVEDSREQLKNCYKYNPENNSWTQIADFGGKGRQSPLSYIYNGNLYVGAGIHFPSQSEGPAYFEYSLFDCWSYNPQTNSWSPATEIPDYTANDATLTIDNIVYKIGGNSTWKISGGSWVLKDEISFLGGSYIVPFTIGTKGYLHRDYTREPAVFEYDPRTGKTVTFKIPEQVANRNPSVFVIGNKGYLVGGDVDYLYEHFVWEFDPSLPAD